MSPSGLPVPFHFRTRLRRESPRQQLPAPSPSTGTRVPQRRCTTQIRAGTAVIPSIGCAGCRTCFDCDAAREKVTIMPPVAILRSLAGLHHADGYKTGNAQIWTDLTILDMFPDCQDAAESSAFTRDRCNAGRRQDALTCPASPQRCATVRRIATGSVTVNVAFGAGTGQGIRDSTSGVW